MAAAQVWTLIALLAAAQFATFVEMRRMGDRMTDGFGELRKEIGELRGEFGGLRGEFGELRGEFAILRHEVHERFTRDH
jgi:hypothetical protein